MSEDDVVNFFWEKRRLGYSFVNEVGGEPYVRSKLLARLAGIFPVSWVTTSCTCPLIPLRNTAHMISVDGPNAEIHDRVRKMLGLYDRLTKNIARAHAEGIGPLFLHVTLNRLNHRHVRQIFETWAGRGHVEGILVSTMTPIRGAFDHELRLGREERIWIVDELLQIQATYGKFLAMTPRMIQRLHPDVTARYTPQSCGTAQLVESFTADGKRKKQCILSKGDCKDCGCWVTTMGDPVGEENTAGSFRESLEIISGLTGW